MQYYLELALVLLLAFYVGFQAGHLLTSFQYETTYGYSKRCKSDDKVDDVENMG